MSSNISARTYELLHGAFDWFNAELFDRRLPPAILVLHRKRNAHGYFHAEQWAERGSNTGEMMHEIALNPQTMSRDAREVLSTLVHEMVHHEQQVFGKPSKGGHHNKEWAEWMDRVGLEPVAADGSGKRTGRKVTHMIVPGGPFDEACRQFLEVNPDAVAVFAAPAEAPKERKRDLSKVKHQCPCCDAKVWGKLGIRVVCMDCDEIMVADGIEEDEDA